MPISIDSLWKFKSDCKDIVNVNMPFNIKKKVML